MSEMYRTSRRKYNQNDIRRLMTEHRSKSKVPQQAKIDSPLAKYNDLGQLTCILCKSIVKSESTWKVHINSKQHKDNIIVAKQLKEQLETSKHAFKRPAQPENSQETTFPEKLRKQVSTEKNQQIPSNFFDSKNVSNYFEATLAKSTIKTDLVKIRREEGMEKANKINADEVKEGPLPEGFFDDPVKDAKIRNQDYKDPHDEEWEKFQREIKEETTLSSAIIAEEQDEATSQRQIEEIDEQIKKWSRVVDLEKKKEVVTTNCKARSLVRMMSTESDTDTSEDDMDTDEFFDWRAKRSDRKV